jgi:RNA polymerase sigma-70 factor (ECF subfamily)
MWQTVFMSVTKRTKQMNFFVYVDTVIFTINPSLEIVNQWFGKTVINSKRRFAYEEAQDAQLMTALASGNDPALNLLIRRWSPRILAYLSRHSESHATALDLTQETFVRLYLNRHRYDPARSFSTWLYTLAGNLLRNHARWQKRHPVTLLEPEALVEQSPPSDAPDPHDQLASNERAAAVRKAIQALPTDLREPLLLSTYEHLPHHQIATILGLSEKAVEMRLYRARQSLRESLKSWLPQSGEAG